MPIYPFDSRTIHWSAPRPHRSGTFRPTGKLNRHGPDDWFSSNPGHWSSNRTLTARLIVGFSVGDRPTYTMEDLIAIVERIRTRQTGNPSASFIAQKGIYQHRDGKTIVHEDGAQVFIINLNDVSEQEFESEMTELAEEIAHDFQQEEVVVEVQLNGISQKTMGIGP